MGTMFTRPPAGSPAAPSPASPISAAGAAPDAPQPTLSPAEASQSTLSVLERKFAMDGITFDDVLLLPRRSAIMPGDADTSTRLTTAIRLNIPLVSAPMDTVTESALAISLALEGGLGIIHKNLSVEAQAREVLKVKRSANGVITDPLTLRPDETVARAKELMAKHNVSGFPVTERGGTGPDKGKLLGILTRRDLKFVEDSSIPIKEVMTSRGLITAPAGTTLQQAEVILSKNKVEKLLLIDGDFHLAGLITMRDIERAERFPRACLDSRGRLRCGAACGVDHYDRVEALLAAEVDVLVVDTAHGHSENVLRTVRTIKQRYDVQVIAGNIATEQAAIDLIEAGADGIKVGIGPGSICTTRVVTGVGVPQITAVMSAARGAAIALARTGRDVPVIADGGVRHSGDIPKALAAGASSVMMGSLFAGLDESPGELVISQGRRYKSYRGMGSEGAMNAGSADRYRQAEKVGPDGRPMVKFVPEGVEGLVPYRGPLADFAYQLVGGIRSSMGYCGCRTISELQRETQFCRVTGATVVENHPHDIRITKESSNYMIGKLGE